MLTLTITEKGGEAVTRDFDKSEVAIGRIQGNDIILPKSNISKKHARILDNGGSFVVVDNKSTNGTYVNGKRIDAPSELKSGDRIFVGDFTIEVHAPGAAAKKAAPPPPPKEEEALAPEPSGGEVLPDDAWAGADNALKAQWEDDWGNDEGESAKPAPAQALAEADAPSVASATANATPKAEPAAPLPSSATPEARRPGGKTQAKAATAAARPERPAEPSKRRDPSSEQAQARSLVHERLLRALDLRRVNVEAMGDDELRTRTRTAVSEIVTAMASAGELPEGSDAEALIDEVVNEAVGLGPLEALLQDDTINEILVNGAAKIYVERRGKIELTDYHFSSDQAVLGVIERIVAPLGRRIDESSPMVDARLKDGSRVNAIVPPLSLRGPILTIRKFTREPLLIDDLVVAGTLTGEMAEFLETCVRARKNIIISGGTGSGKTTTLNVLSSFIPVEERIITIEDAAELKLDQEHVVSLESRPANIEGKGAITIRDLVRNALRMRPDRIVVGECRGGEALDMLQAMNTGHDGSITTVHANGPRDALSRLETMVLMSGMELPVRAIRDQIASAVDIIVQQARFADGSRRITHISEITGMEGDVISMQDIFVFEQKGLDATGKVVGAFRPTGVIPRFFESLGAIGVKADLHIFQRG
jgi:pilus assembly protein CpaF